MKIGIIGLGDMGKMFAKIWDAQQHSVFGCDLPNNYEKLRLELADTHIELLPDAVSVSRICDFILYAVETDRVAEVVKVAGPSTKYGAIVTGQTSVKSPEIAAFEKYLPNDTQIVGSHALFGPNVDPAGQTIAMFNHRASAENFLIVQKLFEETGSKIKELEDYKVHDKMMADIQVVTHVGFESIGTAFMHRRVFPWEDTTISNGLDNIKLLLTLRIYSYKAHVYSGLAFHNPFAHADVRKFAQIENELFGLMITENKQKFISKILKARDIVFANHSAQLLLNDQLLEEYSLASKANHKPNSHLSLLSMVCTWADLKTNPYNSMVCQTPPFKLRVGLAEYLFLNENLLMETIDTALKDKSILKDDLAFHTAVHEWTNILELGDKLAYEKHFNATKSFLQPRLEIGRQKSSELIAKLNV
jgi:prephenate dehydrogenase (NADP+)